jgi:hypothetical protein
VLRSIFYFLCLCLFCVLPSLLFFLVFCTLILLTSSYFLLLLIDLRRAGACAGRAFIPFVVATYILDIGGGPGRIPFFFLLLQLSFWF